MTADREEGSELRIGATKDPVPSQEHQSSGGQVFHHVNGLGPHKTDRNRRLAKSKAATP